MLFGSVALEVAIGMIFVYLLMSLLCSAVVEYIEAKANNRAKDLEKGIRLLLDHHVPEKVSTGEAGEKADSIAQMLYNHPLVKSLYRGEGKLPSYIPARTFSLALWDMVFPADQRTASADSQKLEIVRKAVVDNPLLKAKPELQKALLALMDDAKGDFDQARKNVEDWYDSTMDRVSGWYKRRVHYILLATGLIVATVVNADTINIARALMRNDALRATVVSSAEDASKNNTLAPASTTPASPPASTAPTPSPAERAATAEARIQKVRTELDALGLPIGWVRHPTVPNDPRALPGSIGGWTIKILGLLITAFAVSQGAPFWFDLLNKIIVIRSTVKPKEKSPDQPSKDKPAPDTEKKKPDDHKQP